MRLFFIIILFTAITVLTVSAESITITFSDLDILQKNTKILIYDSNGNLVGEFNTSDTVTLDANDSYIFVFKPSGGDWFSNPFTSIELIKERAPTIFGYILFAVVIAGLGYLITRLVVG